MRSYQERSCRSTSSSELPNTLNRTKSENTTSSFEYETVRDIQKTYELIKFIGCETHHDVLVALRMLTPYLNFISEHEDGHDSFGITAAEGLKLRIEGGHAIRYKSADASAVNRVMSDVLDMYIAAKLSRRKKGKKLEQVRMEVAEKLRVLEEEVSIFLWPCSENLQSTKLSCSS